VILIEPRERGEGRGRLKGKNYKREFMRGDLQCNACTIN